MYEYDVLDVEKNEIIDSIFGHSQSDARQRSPKYSDSKKYHLLGGWYID